MLSLQVFLLTFLRQLGISRLADSHTVTGHVDFVNPSSTTTTTYTMMGLPMLLAVVVGVLLIVFLIVAIARLVSR